MESPSFFAYQAHLAFQGLFLDGDGGQSLAQVHHTFRHQGHTQPGLGPLEAAPGIVGQAAEIEREPLFPAGVLDDPFPPPVAQKGQILEIFQGKGFRHRVGEQVFHPHGTELFPAQLLSLHPAPGKGGPDHGQIHGFLFQGIQQLVGVPFVQLEGDIRILLESG